MRPISYPPLGYDWVQDFSLKRTFDRVDAALQFFNRTVPWFNVLDHDQTVGTGLKDDSEAIQRAIDRTGEAGGGVLYLPEGDYRIDNTLTINHDLVTVMGAGWATHILAQNVTIAFDVNPAFLATLFSVGISSMRMTGPGPGSTAIAFSGAVDSSTFDHLYIDTWGNGMTTGGGVSIINCLVSKNQFTGITATSASLSMVNCRFTDNQDSVGAISGISELGGSSANVFNGNVLVTNPTLVGFTTTACRVHGNVGLTTLRASTSATPSGLFLATQPYSEMSRWIKSAGTGNVNFDTMGVVGTPGRRYTLVLGASGAATPPRSVTLRDTLNSGAGTGGFELKNNADQIVLTGEEWYFFLILNFDQTKWVEIDRCRML